MYVGLFLIGSYYLNREFNFSRLLKFIPGLSEEVKTFINYYSFQEVQYRWRNFRVLDLKLDTCFSIFIFTLLASFIGMNLYHDFMETEAKNTSRASKVTQRQSRLGRSTISNQQYKSASKSSTETELQKLYANSAYQSHIAT